MRGARSLSLVWCLLLASALGACSSSKKGAKPSTTTTVAGATTAPSVGPSTAPTITDLFPTTSLPCDQLPVPTKPLTNPAPATHAVLLTKVQTLGDRCTDHVVFSFTSKATDPPGYTVFYASGPFVGVDSDLPIAVRGKAFISVRLSPAYGYDFENGTPTYTGSKRIEANGANHVTEMVETGDSEGVVNWVIGLDEKRPFTVQATGSPQTQLVVTVG